MSKDYGPHIEKPIPARPVAEIEYDDPFTWPNRRKWLVTVLMALCTLTTTFCSSIWSSTIIVTSQEFDTSETAMVLGVSLFVLGFALGPLFWGPVSELVGRKIPLFSGFFIFAFLQIPIALTHSLAGVLLCRLLAGCFGAAPIGLVSASYADFWDPANRGTATALYSVAAYAGPTLGAYVHSLPPASDEDRTSDRLVCDGESSWLAVDCMADPDPCWSCWHSSIRLRTRDIWTGLERTSGAQAGTASE